MYTRSYYQDNTGGVPKGYDGNAFRLEEAPTVVTPTYGETKISPEYMAEADEEVLSDSFESCDEDQKKEDGGVFSRIFSHIPFKKFPFGFGQQIERLGKIEIEDIIIIAVALLLIFSGEGDKLLGVALLALLFI